MEPFVTIFQLIILWINCQLEKVGSCGHVISAVETGWDALSSRHSNAKILFVEIRVGSSGHLSRRKIHPRPGVREEVTGARVVEGVYTHICPKARGK